MTRLLWIWLFSLTLITACSKDSLELNSLPQDRFIQVYFNHRSDNSSYLEPYRNIERSGDNLESIIVEAIAQANSTIDLAVQELNLPLVATALAKSHRSGVKVRVILDNNYSRSVSELKPAEIARFNQRDRQKYRQLFQLVDLDGNNRLSPQEIAQRDAIAILTQAGIPVIDDTADGSKGSGLMHHKFMVVDGKTVVTGSANFTLSGVYGDLNNLATRGNINHLLEIENAQIADLFTEEFNYMWGDNPNGGSNSRFGLKKPWRKLRAIAWSDTDSDTDLDTEVMLQFAPTSSSKGWHLSTSGSISEIINHATESIDLALFVFSEQKLADTLQQKQQEGIKIQGVFDSSFAYRYYSEVLDMLGVTLYLRCQPEADNNPWVNPIDTVGIPTIAPGDKLHHKFAAIDDRVVISGSHNWSQAANQNNDETLIAIDNPTVARHFVREFDRLYSSLDRELPTKIKDKLERQQQCN